MDARAAGGAAAGRRCQADRTSRTSHNAKCTMQDKQNISKCRTSRISQSTMQEKQNFTVYCTQVIVQCTMQESKTSRIAHDATHQYPTNNATRTHPQADWAIALASLLPSAEVLLVATQPQNARTPECPHNAPLATLLPTPQMPQRWFHRLCTAC